MHNIISVIARYSETIFLDTKEKGARLLRSARNDTGGWFKKLLWNYLFKTVLVVFLVLGFTALAHAADSPVIPDTSFPNLFGNTQPGTTAADYFQGAFWFVVGSAGLIAFSRIVFWQGKSSMEESVQNQEGRRNAIKEVGYGLLILCSIGMILYLFYGKNFTVTLPTLGAVTKVDSLTGPGVNGSGSTANCGILFCTPGQQICESPGHCIPDPNYGKNDPCGGKPKQLCPPTRDPVTNFQMECGCGKNCAGDTTKHVYECN